MASIFEDIGEFFTGAKGKEAEEQAKAQQEQYSQMIAQQQQLAAQQQQAANEAETRAGGYTTQANQAMGGSVLDQMRMANEAAKNQAGENATAMSMQAIRNGLKAARSSGLNRGQSAITAGQQGADAYNRGYQGGIETGTNQYNQGVNQRLNQANTERSTGLGHAGLGVTASGQALGAQGNQVQNQQQNITNAKQDAATGGNTINGILTGASSIFSDENMKTDVTPSRDRLSELVAKVRPVDFKYKDGSGQNPQDENKGVMAQDLEKTDMKDNVIDTPQGKVVDTAKQTMSNTNLIVQMARELVRMQDQMDSMGAK